MELITLEKQKMDIVSEMATTNIKISEAKNLLITLQEEETEYLEAREKKALVKIEKVLSESRELLNKAHGNYEYIHEFCQTLTNYADFLHEAHEKFKKMLETFEKRNEIWDENVKQINQDLADQRHAIKQDTEAIETREKRIAEGKEAIRKGEERIESRQQALLMSYEAEKKLWEKLQTKSK